MFPNVIMFKTIFFIFKTYLDYVKETTNTEAALRTNYNSLFTILNRVKQGNLSRNEVVNLYSLARRLLL